MKNYGIWLDKNQAYIILLENGKETMTTIQSNIEHYRIHGGSGTRLKGGPQDVVQDSRYLEREKHQFRRYFAEIAERVKDADQLMIFGPADIDRKFKKEIEESYKDLDKKVILVEKADSMTENQMVALVRDSYSKTING